MIIKLPLGIQMWQKNRKKKFGGGFVSPQDGTPVRLRNDIICDDHGNELPASELSPTRFTCRFREWLKTLPAQE